VPRTRLSVCRRKRRYASRGAAIAAAVEQGWLARPYACNQCRRFHLTSRRSGGLIPRAIRDAALAREASSGTGPERV